MDVPCVIQIQFEEYFESDITTARLKGHFVNNWQEYETTIDSWRQLWSSRGFLKGLVCSGAKYLVLWERDPLLPMDVVDVVSQYEHHYRDELLYRLPPEKICEYRTKLIDFDEANATDDEDDVLIMDP